MTTNSAEPLDRIDPEETTPDDVDESEVRAALSSSNLLTQQRGAKVCESLAQQDIDAVRPFLDEIAALASADSTPVVLRAISTLDTVAGSDPAALDGRLSDLGGVLDTDIVDVQLAGATLLGKLVVERPDLLAPCARQLIEAVRRTEPDSGIRDFSDVVEDRVTQRTFQEHEEAERKRRVSGRRTLINVVVAITEEEPRSSFDLVDDLVTLLDDVDPAVSGAAVDALGELAAANPDVVAPVSDRLIDCLDHDRTVVRARAIRALGYLGDDVAVPKLRTVAEEDPDEDIQEIAARTANFLADTS